MREVVDRRVLGAVEFIDAVTAARMRGRLRIAPTDKRVSITANASALYVIRSAPGLEHHLHEFERPPSTPALESLSFEISVTDPARRYLPRTTRIRLPRKDAPITDARSVLNPIVVRLYPAGAADVGANWAVLRARVQMNDGSERGLGNALVVVTPQLAGFTPVTAMTDERGEALVAIPGVAPVMPGVGGAAVLTREFACAVEVVFDRRVVFVEGEAAGLADPESIAAARLAGDAAIVVRAQPSISLSAGKSVHATAQVAWP